MNAIIGRIALVLLALQAGCASAPKVPAATVQDNSAAPGEQRTPASAGVLELDFDFARGRDHGFVALFRDLPTAIFDEYMRRKTRGQSLGPVAPLDKGPGEYPEDDSHWLLNSGIFPLPDNLPGYGFLVQGSNRSDDLDYGLGKFLDRSSGLEPNTEYAVSFKVDIAANAGSGGSGVGGGQTINLAGIVTPLNAGGHIVREGYVRWPQEIGRLFYNAPGVGSNVVCTIGLTMPGRKRCPAGRIPFAVVTGMPSKPFRFRTDDRGEAWIVIAGHSGFESFASFYFTRILVRFQKAVDQPR